MNSYIKGNIRGVIVFKEISCKDIYENIEVARECIVGDLDIVRKDHAEKYGNTEANTERIEILQRSLLFLNEIQEMVKPKRGDTP